MPAFLRDVWPAGVRTIDEVFGRGKVPDDIWMQMADREGWVAVCKDDRIRRRIGERHLMSRGSLRVFCLANGNLLRDEQVARFARNLEAMIAVVEQPGPWMRAVYTDRLEALTLYA